MDCTPLAAGIRAAVPRLTREYAVQPTGARLAITSGQLHALQAWCPTYTSTVLATYPGAAATGPIHTPSMMSNP
ncbi:hypothetical protein OPT61_g4470 [Boeremia exigua]|uniref:Uncharacterized protein n=1 Tax=Boeremia exigua TaxID=749465 RepID=A0ACC2IE04_9PLEO|nr:hypothetical protein OPT61_g4470 [Boeremia exigua]